MTYAKIGAAFYFLWGLLHIVGGGVLLAASIKSPEAGYAFYADAQGAYPPAAGAVLAYNSFAIIWIGALTAVIAVTMNWKNRPAGAWLNFALAGLSDVGLIVFLMAPGFVPVASGAQGISLFVLAAVFTAAGLVFAKRAAV